MTDNAQPRTAGTLAEDIAAMLHYRGRVLHPRSHPKTHGGPCDECAEAGRQAAEFAGSPPTILIRDCEATDHYAADAPPKIILSILSKMSFLELLKFEAQVQELVDKRRKEKLEEFKGDDW